jgi:hypothetical protein
MDGQYIRGAIKRHFGSTNAFGRAVGRSHTFVWNVINGKKILSEDEERDWAEIFAERDLNSLAKE